MINIAIYINGVDRTNLVLQSSFSKTDALYSTPDVLKFTIQSHIDQTYEPTVNSEVVVYDGPSKIYGGTIMNSDKSIDLASRLVDVDVTCVDYGQLLDRQLIIERLEDTTLETIVTYLLATYYPSFTATFPGDDVDVKSITFNNISISKALDKLCKLTNYQWYVDYNKVVHIFKTFDEAAPFNISDTNGLYIPDSLTVSEDLSQLKNRITIKGGEVPVNPVEFELLGSQGTVQEDGATTFDTVYKFASKPTITRNGNPVEVGVVGFDSDFTGTWEAMWSFQEKYVTFDIYVDPADEITMSGIPLEPIQVRLQNSQSINKYGRWDVTMHVPGIKSREEAIQYAEAQRNTYSIPVYSVRFSTYESGLRSGQTINVDSEKFGINEDFFIQRVSFKMMSRDKGIWTVEASTAREISLLDILSRIVGIEELEESFTEGLDSLLDIPIDSANVSDMITSVTTKEGPYTVWPSVGDGLYEPAIVNFSTMGEPE